MLHETIFFLLFMSDNCIGMMFWKMALVTAIMGEISSWFSAMDNALLHVYEYSPTDKIEEQNNFALIHALLYLDESDDERDNKYSATNTFDVSCGSGGYSSSLSTITVSVSATYNVVCCWIFTSAWFLPNDPLSSDDMVDLDNDSMLLIGGRDTNINISVTQLVITMKEHYGMLLWLFRCQLIHINHASINIATSVIGGQRWHSIWHIRWIRIRYLRNVWLWSCVMWRSGWLLKKRGQLRCIDDWIIQWISHRYHRWWQLIALWVSVLDIKALVITWSVLWRAGLLLMNRGQLMCIDYWIFQWSRHRYQRWWQLVALWVNFLDNKSPFIMRIPPFPTLIVPCSTFVATINTLWTWHD